MATSIKINGGGLGVTERTSLLITMGKEDDVRCSEAIQRAAELDLKLSRSSVEQFMSAIEANIDRVQKGIRLPGISRAHVIGMSALSFDVEELPEGSASFRHRLDDLLESGDAATLAKYGVAIDSVLEVLEILCNIEESTGEPDETVYITIDTKVTENAVAKELYKPGKTIYYPAFRDGTTSINRAMEKWAEEEVAVPVAIQLHSPAEGGSFAASSRLTSPQAAPSLQLPPGHGSKERSSLSPSPAAESDGSDAAGEGQHLLSATVGAINLNLSPSPMPAALENHAAKGSVVMLSGVRASGIPLCAMSMLGIDQHSGAVLFPPNTGIEVQEIITGGDEAMGIPPGVDLVVAKAVGVSPETQIQVLTKNAAVIVKKLREDPTSASWWIKLGTELDTGDSIVIDGTIYDKKACYAKAVKHDPTMMIGWVNIGAFAGKFFGSVDVNGTAMTRRDCLREALKNTADAPPDVCCAAWFYLASVLVQSDDSEMINGQPMFASDCCLEALRFDRNNSLAWTTLGNALSKTKRGQKTVQFMSKQYDAAKCYAEALTIEPLNSFAWSNLGLVMSKWGSAKIADLPYSKRECLVRSIELNPKLADSWEALPETLFCGCGTIKIRGEKFSKDECWEQAMKFRSQSPRRRSSMGAGDPGSRGMSRRNSDAGSNDINRFASFTQPVGRRMSLVS